MKTLRNFLLAGLLLYCLSSHAQPALTVTQVSAGNQGALFILSDGSLWAVGDNSYGQLGAGSNHNAVLLPAMIVSNGVTAVSCGASHSAFIKSDGSLWAMGFNHTGGLGDGTTNDQYLPEKILSSGVTSVSCGWFHTLYTVRTVTGVFPHQTFTTTLYGMGYNADGELGDGTTNNRVLPVPIYSTNTSFGVTAACGADHTVFTKPDGTMWGMGGNQSGQLGDGTTVNKTTPEVLVNTSIVNGLAAGDARSFFIQADGSLWGAGDNQGALGDGTTSQRLSYVKVATNVVSVSTATAFTAFIKGDGSLWGTGSDTSGQLGDGASGPGVVSPVKMVSSGVTAVAVSFVNTYYIKSDGSLWGVGDDAYGELGDDFNRYHAPPTRIYPPPPQPLINQDYILSRTNLEVFASCYVGGWYALLTSTDLTQPKAGWTALGSNYITDAGVNNYFAIYTNAVHPGELKRFYTLHRIGD
jgi:alpha-tubulin suppressor-like RCC1 family protein